MIQTQIEKANGTRETARASSGNRARLLDGLPFEERRLTLAGISTAILEAGEGPPIILLHGPGEFGANWMRVMPDLATTHSVIAPDLPGHGASTATDDAVEPRRVLEWLDALIDATCTSHPVLVGHVLGGAIGARFAAARPDRLGRLVLVDSLGLAPFRPTARFALRMAHFLARPGPRTYDRFMRQCSYDLDGLRQEMGDRWEPFESYALELAQSPGSRAAGRLMREMGIPRIDPEDLARITIPTALIWGREDRANRLRVAEAAHERYGWPLHVIDDCADDPARDRPSAFLRALRMELAPTEASGARI